MATPRKSKPPAAPPAPAETAAPVEPVAQAQPVAPVAATPDPVPPVLTHLRVAARRDGFRRCGRAWPAVGVTVAKTEFTPDQVATLLADPDLVVTEIPGAPA